MTELLELALICSDATTRSSLRRCLQCTPRSSADLDQLFRHQFHLTTVTEPALTLPTRMLAVRYEAYGDRDRTGGHGRSRKLWAIESR